jgi:hypothetical protein
MRKMKWTISFIALFFIMLTACKKQAEPLLVDGNIVFLLSGLMNDESKQIEAGKNSFYLFTSYEKSATQSLKLKANLKKTCTDCKEAYEFIFHEGSNNNSPADSLLKPGKYSFYTNRTDTTISYKVAFKADHFNQQISSYTWRFPDGSTSNDSTPVKTYSEAKNINVILLIKYANNCQADVSLPVRINKGMAVNPIRFNYTFVQGTTRYVSFVPVLSDTVVKGKFIWEFGDGSSSETFGGINHNYQDSGAFKVCLKTLYANDTLSYCQRIKTPDKKNCIANFNQNIDQTINISRENAIEIKYTDANGNVFSSIEANQDPLSYFEVLNIGDYLKNELNQSTKSLDIRFNCNLKGSSGLKKMQNFQGKIAVAIP